MADHPNSFDARSTLEVGDRELEIFRLDALQSKFDVARLPFSLKILLENLLRTEGNGAVDAADVEALATWDAKADPSKEIAFTPARVVMQDFTGVPAVVDLAAMRDAMADLGGDPAKIVGTDSHTTMINGLGVLGWGVGGIEAEAAMLGQPMSMLIPQVIGFRLSGALPEGATATDLVLTVTELLRKKGVVGKFVEFYGSGLSTLSVPDRATIANMAPEYGATMGFFPVDNETLAYLHFTSRSHEQIALVEAYCKEQMLFRTDSTPEPALSDKLELDLASVEPTVAGPKRPQDRVPLTQAKASFTKVVEGLPDKHAQVKNNGDSFDLSSGAVVIAAITSCTNTSNPSLMLGAGLLAKKAVERGLTVKPWVKTSLAPGSTAFFASNPAPSINE